MKNILVITTGGTIACTNTGTGLVPTMTGEQMLALVPQCRHYANLTCKALMNLDSTNIQPEDCRRIAEAIRDEKEQYDGIVVLHGTDTMAYSAAAVSFMTLGVQKPVVFTGAQIPISQPDSDAFKNLSDAVYTAAMIPLSGVYVVFCGRIINGSSVCKTDTQAFDAFSSVNTVDVGEVDSARAHLAIRYAPIRDSRDVSWRVSISADVLLLKLYPGARPSLLDYEAVKTYRTVILEAFGAGGIPALERSFLPQIRELCAHKILTVITTQCWHGASDISIYEVGRNAAQCGAVSAGYISGAALVSKMMWAVSITDDFETLKQILMTDYCGEFGHFGDGDGLPSAHAATA